LQRHATSGFQGLIDSLRRRPPLAQFAVVLQPSTDMHELEDLLNEGDWELVADIAPISKDK
jgi:hypothetical protein